MKMRHGLFTAALMALAPGMALATAAQPRRYRVGPRNKPKRSKQHVRKPSRTYREHVTFAVGDSPDDCARISAAAEKRERKNQHRLKCAAHGGFYPHKRCKYCNQRSIVNLDNEDLCQEHADAWVRAEDPQYHTIHDGVDLLEVVPSK